MVILHPSEKRWLTPSINGIAVVAVALFRKKTRAVEMLSSAKARQYFALTATGIFPSDFDEGNPQLANDTSLRHAAP